MKRIIIGDPHGRWNALNNIYKIESPDEVVVLGDYFDSFDIDVFYQKETYENIISLRKEHLSKHKGRFIMLIGNHDFHYMSEFATKGSGYESYTASLVGPILCRDWDKEILQMVFVDELNKTIYSHAGISMNWFSQWIKSNSLGDINTIEAKAFQFTYKDGGNWSGSSPWNSPLWIRPEGLKKSPYKDKNGNIWSQVCGHTSTVSPLHWQIDNADFYIIDCINIAYLVEDLDENMKVIKRNVKFL